MDDRLRDIGEKGKAMKRKKFSCKRDDLTIRGWWYLPEGADGKLPTAIISHGFMGNYNGERERAKLFASLGFASLIYDFNGGGLNSHSDGKTTEMSVLTEKEDLKAVIAAACELPFVDENDITLVGCSQGGFVSAMTASDLQEKIRRLILYFPALCIPDDARKGQMILAKFDPENIPETVVCGPMKLGRRYVTDVIGMDPYRQIREYRGPVLILHGSKDELVNASYAHEAYKQYLRTHGKAPSKDCQLVMIDGGNHGFHGRGSKAWKKYVEFAIRKFLEGKMLWFNVDVRLTDSKTEKQEDGSRKVKLYFEGYANSGAFRGNVRMPAYDEQIFRGREKEPETCCAAYTVEGIDYTGAECTVDITNRMLPGKKRDWDTDWQPTVHTSSEALSSVNELPCETYAEQRKVGPHIHIWG